MSTILDALDRKRSDADGDPEAILERNAAYREALRRKRPSSARQRKTLILSSVSLILALVCIVVLTWSWVYGPWSGGGGAVRRGADARDADVAPPSEAGAAPAPALSAQRRSAMREKVKLRTRPLLRNVDPSMAGRPSIPGYGVGPGAGMPATAPSPVATPQPDVVVSDTGAAVRTSESSPDAAAEEPQPTPAKKVARNDPNEFLHLTGIIRDPEKPQVLINNHILAVGDTIEGAKVLAIDNGSSVRVQYRGKTYTLVLK